MTVTKGVERWLGHATLTDSLRPTTIQRYHEVYVRHLEPVIGGELVDHVKEREVRSLRARMGREVGPATLNQCRAVLRGLVRFLREDLDYRGPDVSDFWRHAKPRPPRHVEVYLPAEVERIAAAAGERDGVLFRTAAYTGLRLSELRALRWRDVDLDAARIVVHAGYTNVGGDGPTKGKRTRSVPIVPQLLVPLATLSLVYDDPEERVFQETTGAVLNEFSVRRRFLAACERAEVRALNFHSLRHSCLSIMVQAFPLSDVQAYAGHTSIVTTSRYLHLIDQKDAAQKFGKIIEEMS
jgi:integrase